MSVIYKVLEVNLHEKKLLDAIESGFNKLRLIQEETGFNYATTVYYLKQFRDSGDVLYDKLQKSYKLSKKIKYKLCKERKDEPIHIVNPIAPTFHNRFNHQKMNSEVIVSRWTPEEVIENEKKANAHQKYLEYKRGELFLNENYDHAKHSR